MNEKVKIKSRPATIHHQRIKVLVSARSVIKMIKMIMIIKIIF
jgi:hypothetical protein